VAVVVLGNGDGSFRVPQRSLAQSPLGYLRAADLDGDGDLDLVGTTLTNADSYLNAGDGTFTFVASYKIDGVVWDHQLADLDGDSRPDLLAVAYNGDVVVHLGQGDGTFGPEARTASVGSATALGVGDFDGDGAVDVLTAGSPCGFLKGDGKGGFAAAVGLKGSGAAQVLPLDADGDGKLDFVTDEDQVWLGNGDGSFSAGAAVPNPGWAYAMAAGDCDSDGDLDLMYVDNWPQIMVNDGKGGFSAGWKPMSPGPTMRAVAAADLDGDGNVDFVVSRDGRTCSAYRGLGDCTFVDGGSWTPGCQLALDFDGDGLPDLAQTADSGDILVTFNRSR